MDKIDWGAVTNGVALVTLGILAGMMIGHEVPAGSREIVAGICGALGGFLTGTVVNRKPSNPQ